METKDYVTLALSGFAVCLSLFNLWWGTFRRRIALFFIQGSFGWRYALVNGGKTDILVTEVTYWFSGENAERATAPVQECEEKMPVLLRAGTALQHRVNFTDQEDDLKLLFQLGRPIPDQETRALTVKATIDWIDNNGEEHSAEVEVAETTIDHNFFRSWRPRTRRADLLSSRFARNTGKKPLALMLEWASRKPRGSSRVKGSTRPW